MNKVGAGIVRADGDEESDEIGEEEEDKNVSRSSFFYLILFSIQ